MSNDSAKVLSEHITMDRSQRLEQLTQAEQIWDLVIVGGGVVGAGLLKRASQAKLKVLLVEQRDFAWGSSSRSSKMVHGGLRYIAEGQVRLTKESVLEREKLLKDAPLLVTKQSFAMSHYKKQFPWPWLFSSLLKVYDSIANLADGNRRHKQYQQQDYLMLVPGAKEQELIAGTQFYDAMTDDTRLVQRLIQESLQLGGQAINYCAASNLIEQDGKIVGLNVKAEELEQEIAIKAKMVVNATGAWTNTLLQNSTSKTSDNETESLELTKLNMRPLRGSHIILPNWRLPVATCVSVRHPVDKRPVQIYPWLNTTMVGTTDVEHSEDLSKEAKISQQEFDYLMATVENQFPAAKITADDVISTFAGIRPVVSQGGAIDPSKEKREHSIKHVPGLITVAGGKLTTFDVIAEDVLSLLQKETGLNKPDFSTPVFAKASTDNKANLPKHINDQAIACFGELSDTFIAQSSEQSLTPISYTRHLWAELAWAAKYEQIVHLDDLLLRRTRLGNLLTQGGQSYLDKIKDLCQQTLNWSDEKWQQEVSRYQQIWQQHYSLPEKLTKH